LDLGAEVGPNGLNVGRDGLDLLKRLNQLSADRHPRDTELQARLNSYDLAYRMESSAPEAVDVSKESAAVKDLYGLNDEESKDYGTVLLRARRLVERNVRFIHVVTGHIDVDGDSQDWDAHGTWRRTTARTPGRWTNRSPDCSRI
jgi:hypothetical protein